jgi:hypothetical protein
MTLILILISIPPLDTNHDSTVEERRFSAAQGSKINAGLQPPRAPRRRKVKARNRNRHTPVPERRQTIAPDVSPG